MSVTRFRPELEGLRGIAVILVIAAHAGIAFPGAAIGPDLFFVLSGYLITGLLLRRLDAGRGIELGAFYARRLRRLLPAAVVAVGLTVGAVALLGDPFALERAAHDGIAALTGTANLRFAITLQDYFAPTEPSVFLPLWSLGVEEQFCLLVPLLVGLAYRAGGRRAVALLVALIAIASTVAAIVLTASDPVWAYYLLPTRAYAIAIGALIALGERRVHALGAPVGLVVLGVILALVPGEEGYPGVVGPLAALASALLIGGMAHGGLIARCIATPPLRLVGRISYSLFLLHWPFLVIPVMYGIEMTPALTALAVTGSITSAIALYLIVERPFREGRLIGDEPRRIFPRVGALAGTAVLVLASLSGPPVTSAGDPVSSALPIAIAPIPTPRSTPIVAPSTPTALTPWAPIRIAAGTVTTNGPLPADLRPDLATADRDADDVLRSGCGLAHDGDRPPLCLRGIAGGRKIAIIGTSHAAHWVPAIEVIAARDTYEIRPFVKVNCPFVDHRVFAARLGRPYHECHTWREAVIEAVNAWNPELILIASARHEDLDGQVRGAAESAEAVARLLRRLEAPVAIIADNPYGQVDIPSCLARHREEISACVLPRAATAYGYSTARDLLLAERESLPLIDFTPTFCPNGRCAPIIDGIVVYHDHHHLTVTMSRHLAGPLGAAIDQIIAAVAR